VYRRIVTAAAAGASCVAFAAGCGSSHSSSDSPKLAKAIPPSCGVDRFTPARTGPAPGRTGGWELIYQFPANPPRPPQPGETTVVDLVEEPPVSGHPRLKGGHDVTVAGRTVSLVPGAGVRRATVAQWTTRAARYIIIANGSSTDTLNRIVGCLP
jgi:hypothetical protein